jgi:hypothetical protein
VIAAACALGALLGAGESAAKSPAGPLALVMAGATCPDSALAEQLELGLRKRGGEAISHSRVSAALARVRATRALEQARRLYTRTDFAGCIALTSITEQELGRSLADVDARQQQRAHALLAEVNLWLGICQWAAGDPQTAATAFVRSAQLPSRPVPDPKLLPPELVEAHRAAVTATRAEMVCEVEAPLRGENLLVDGREPVTEGQSFRVLTGTHYLTLRASCAAPSTECERLQRRIGPDGIRSLRLEAGPLRCRVQLPSTPVPARITCAALSEARDPRFVADLTREAGTGATLVGSFGASRIAVRIHRRGASGFARQLVSDLESESAATVLGRSLDLVLDVDARPVERPGPRKPWYERWWVWAIVGGVVAAGAATAAGVASSSGSKDYRVVFR